ncbi:diaminopimelate epimerase [Paenilisteria rocourtiae]|uniref:Diaminopimelate epimerase n=1 Tax=Listeria rocourtiae TaxID=647910 RepID=A0A4R6ZRS9_9LIST|nr:diaminopimelate epimerase [Listeria rocourtiae]EUJ45164.1 diaminopimelate epimerase [Listeria rocourtiae FSL F6-920]MBC1434643.1 diaminopimelate epimerase [Listeria rocourtiae]MBC1603335.1 diaminopimelate epimerase [Listeria rocourtiae]TDR55380.1 diaminopimelate epimerase [Listeria rocourtiae]
MAHINFIKVHGSQNDFFLIDEAKNNLTDWQDTARAKLARRICNREEALGGADGILFVSPSSNSASIGRMRVFNADGSEASMCGNGLRTVARYLLEEYDLQEATIETMKAVLQVSKAEEIGVGIPTYQVEISPVLFAPETLPLNWDAAQMVDEVVPDFDADLHFSAVAVPNPHLITFVNQKVLDSDKQVKLATYLNGENPYFTDGVNVSFVKELAEDTIYVRTFERGVGFTNACGTAMSASSLMKKLLHNDKLETPVHVYNNGGRVKVTASKDQAGGLHLQLIGNATFVYDGVLAVTDTAINLIKKRDTNEQANYQAMVEEVQAFLQKNK